MPRMIVMKKLVFLWSLLLFDTSSCTAANILAILPMASPSHHIWNSPLLIALANKGHNVTVVSATAQKTKVPHLTDLEFTGIIDELQEYDYEEFIQMSPMANSEILLTFMGYLCERFMKSNAWDQLMAYPSDTKFDLIILESIGAECLIGSIQKFGIPPIVVVNGFNVPPWMLEMVGTPNVVSHMPHYYSSLTDHMSFIERAMNLIYTAHTHYMYYYWYVPEMDRIAREYFGDYIPSYSEIVKNVSLGMANFHPVLDFSYAKTPNLIPIAGIQLRDPKPLPQDIKKFLDDAKDGAIFFSLGSNLKSNKISLKLRQAFIEAFAEIPQKVLWKFEDDSLPGQSKNVKIGKWLPQSDILAHPNIKLFITHSGLLSTHEAIYRGVPVLGIPFYTDQPINIDKMERFGVGLRLDFKDITKDSLIHAINTILKDPSYRENMKALSRKFTDNPDTALERAVYWSEYVLRHKGALHMRSGAFGLNMVQYFLLDVIAFVLAMPTLLLCVVYCLCCRRQSKEHRKIKTN